MIGPPIKNGRVFSARFNNIFRNNLDTFYLAGKWPRSAVRKAAFDVDRASVTFGVRKVLKV